MILKLAWRNLFRNTRRTVLTVLLIGFSLAALILADAIILGTIKVMVDSVTHTLAGEVQIHKKGFLDTYDVDLYLEDSSSLQATVAQSSEVTASAPRVITGGMISSPYNVSSGLVYGIDADREQEVSRIAEAVTKGNYLTGKPAEILLGTEMADLLEVELGDRIVITLAEVDTGELSQALFRVSGIFEFGIREFDNNLVFINLAKAREILAMDDASHEIAIRVTDPDMAREADSLFEGMADRADITVQSWREFNPQIGSMIEMTSYSSLIVGGVLFLLASLGVINSMFMSIYERIYEFGVVKALGTRPGDIVRLVMCEASLIAVVSVIFGMILGGALGVYYAEHGVPIGEFEVSGIAIHDNLPAVLSIAQFTRFPLFVVLLTVIAATYPAIYAARILPSRALQRTL